MLIGKTLYRTHKYLFVFLSLMMFVFVYSGQASAFSGPGAGTVNDPFLIANCVQLQEMEDDLDAAYELADDIDCSDTANWNGLKGFNPVGDADTPFTGRLDGNSHVITDLTIIRADDTPGEGVDDETFVGLFGYTDGAVLTDIELGSAKVKGFSYVGGIVGYMEGGVLDRSDVNRDVADNDCDPGHCVWARYGEYGGGLVGFQDGGNIANSSTDGPVKGSGNMIGGLVGGMGNLANLETSYAQGNVDGGHRIGGAVGTASNSDIYWVHAIGNVDANTDEDFKQGQYAGGLVGYATNTTIRRSYATGSVHADQYNAGGLVGEMIGGVISDSYATGSVDAVTYVGGLVGTLYDDGTIRRSYASGSVTASGSTAGGFIAEALITTGDANILIEHSFAAGEVTSPASSGGFISNLGGDVTLMDNAYDMYRTNHDACTGTGLGVANCQGVNAANSTPNYFFNNSLYAPLDEWDFVVVWNVNDSSYPTLDDGVDQDNDGSNNKAENAGPNDGDANDDGTPDAEQANVYSFFNPFSNNYQVLETDCESASVIVIDDPEYETDADYTYPTGLLSFSIECENPGDTAAVEIYSYGIGGGSEYVVRKSSGSQYETIPGYQSTGITIDGEPVSKVSYSLTDGGELDEDGVEDGTIIDPVGVALALAAAPGEDDSEGSGSASDPSDSELANTGQPMLLISLLGLGLIGSSVIIFRRQLQDL